MLSACEQLHSGKATYPASLSLLHAQISCADPSAGCLQRISAYDRLTNAVREIVPDIMNTAANMDVQLATMLANGTALPLLFCVPILVKDNFDFMDGKYTGCQYACADCFNAIRHSKYYKLCSGHMPGALFVNCSRLWEMLRAITDNAGNIAVLTLALLCTVYCRSPGHCQRCCGTAGQLP